MVVPCGAHATVAAASCSRRRRGGGCANAGACAATLRQRRCIAGATLALGGVGVEPSWAAFGANAVDQGHGDAAPVLAAGASARRLGGSAGTADSLVLLIAWLCSMGTCGSACWPPDGAAGQDVVA